MGKGLSGPEPWQSEVTIFAKKKEEKPVNNVSGNWFALLLKSPAADMAEMFAARQKVNQRHTKAVIMTVRKY